jgi:hypothetical protein
METVHFVFAQTRDVNTGWKARVFEVHDSDLDWFLDLLNRVPSCRGWAIL